MGRMSGAAAVRVLAVLLLLGIAAAAAGAWFMDRYLSSPMPVAEETLFELRSGRGLSSVARGLHEQGLLTHPKLFVAFGRLTGQAARLQAGEYQIPVGETPRTLMARLVSGNVFMRSVTLIEGWTFRQALAHLREQPGLRIASGELDDEALMAAIWSQGDAPPGGSLEGWIFPDTYFYTLGTTDLEILSRGALSMRAELAAAWERRAPELSLDTPYEALVLASIIEKETGLDAEREQVAGVMTKRLRRGMRLQTDPTVIYGLGDAYDGNIRRADLARDTPYNTYTRSGLPPTPIALPGRASLRAAVTPAEGDALYFVATGEPDGSHYFSATLEEHNAAVRRYLDRLARSKREQP